MSLDLIREEINKIDKELTELFVKRMNCSRRVAESKMKENKPILNTEREKEILDKVEADAGEFGSEARIFFSSLIEISRSYQYDFINSDNNLEKTIHRAKNILNREKPGINVGCYGNVGTYTNQACDKFFPNAKLKFYKYFKDIFNAIENNEIEFGVLPIENSLAGSVTDVYDLVIKHRYYIVGEVDVPINHCLAVKKGTNIDNIKEVYTHTQALHQCSKYIEEKGYKAIEYYSTADSAKFVSQSNKDDIAVICSESAIEEYGLELVQKGIQNQKNNCTRFIVISKKLYITEGADKISLCFAIPHTIGSLYLTLSRFALHGLNLTKIESRPMEGGMFEYIFYVDIIGNINQDNVLKLISALSQELQQFSFLGNYSEI